MWYLCLWRSKCTNDYIVVAHKLDCTNSACLNTNWIKKNYDVIKQKSQAKWVLQFNNFVPLLSFTYCETVARLEGNWPKLAQFNCCFLKLVSLLHQVCLCHFQIVIYLTFNGDSFDHSLIPPSHLQDTYRRCLLTQEKPISFIKVNVAEKLLALHTFPNHCLRPLC